MNVRSIIPWACFLVLLNFTLGLFAKEHPKIAGRLGINRDTIEDPHASRLIEGFAYLNARIQHKLDDEFQVLT